MVKKILGSLPHQEGENDSRFFGSVGGEKDSRFSISQRGWKIFWYSTAPDWWKSYCKGFSALLSGLNESH
ncbi:hypothetical protein MA16_Dca026615 [Dendrobium catenatum]|uniref:Uncharacterized protein n=1 Tax=Dendrobium catenatum TaxID=906689 RepID=A0A2I0V816_9ASPA|nr:hypothetical protein MA16_Dca026615 [Dendrobium catenatum]